MSIKIFLSWSGETIKQVALALHAWLPDMFPGLEPWMSQHDITAGSRWQSRLDSELASAKFGILCLTQDNLNAPWLIFEAGSLSKDPQLSQVVPYRFNVLDTDVGPPLAQFQSVKSDKSGTLKLVFDINTALSEPASTDRVQRAFEKWWPDLEHALSKIAEPGDVNRATRRSDRDLLEEIVRDVRELRAAPGRKP